MPALGGLCSYPRRAGGGTPIAKVVLDSLNAARGTAYDTSEGTAVYAENYAFAMAITAGYATNERARNQLIPLKMTSMLPRWERMLRIIPAPGVTQVERRRAVHNALARIGQESVYAQLYTEISNAVGDFFVGIEHTDLSIAAQHVPDGTYPWGTVSPESPWFSTTAHVLMRLTTPSGYSEADYVAARDKVTRLADSMLPAWVTFAVYRSPGSGAYAVTGGASAAGFFLDRRNLDNSVFGT